MPIRKGRKEAAHKLSKVQQRLRTLPPTQKKADLAKEKTSLSIDLKRARDFKWPLEQISREYQHKRRTTMPADLKPMLASAKEAPFNDQEWLFEIKWDGYRSLAYVSNGKVELRSRNNLSFNRRFASVLTALKEWPVNAVVDGEVVVLGEDGRADFAALQAWEKQPRGELIYVVFDILWLEGIDLQREPLSTRRNILRRIIPEDSIIRFSDCIDQYGIDFFNVAKANGLEGIVAKRKDSLYKTDARTKDWYKIKADIQHEAIICGYTKNRGTDRLFSSLILGIPTQEGLQFIGQVGTGFSQLLQERLMERFRPLTTNMCPFKVEPDTGAVTQWLRPVLLCEVRYTELTKEGVMRHPTFERLREDKSAFDYNADEITSGDNKPADLTLSRNLLGENDQTAVVSIENKEVTLTNLSKVFWIKENITKGDLLNYYHAIASYILPYLKDRPQSLNRFPNGVDGSSFYQKDMKGKVASWLTTFERVGESSGSKDFLVCTGEASLLYMVNLGCIEMNPWHSRVESPHFPDWCVIDLDPGRIAFSKVIETAIEVRRLLDSLGIPSFPKTSGSEGLHIYIPLGAKYSYDQSRQLAELIAVLVHQQLPGFTSIERSPSKRTTKIYIDYLQNRPIQTICAPYSVRPKRGAMVSAPLHWDEVKKGLQLSRFTLRNMLDRVNSEGDLFTGLMEKGVNLNEILKTLAGVVTR